MRFANASILQAFDESAVGSKVVDAARFLSILSTAVESFDFAGQTTPGQGFIMLPAEANATVSAGMGRHRNDPDAYALRSWRGSVSAYLRREYAAPVEGVAAVVYTKAAYLADPDVEGDEEETRRIRRENPDYIIVAVLAFAGPKAPLSPGRLVSNLAGGNKDALAWDADTIREKARESVAYHSEWGVVAD